VLADVQRAPEAHVGTDRLTADLRQVRDRLSESQEDRLHDGGLLLVHAQRALGQLRRTSLREFLAGLDHPPEGVVERRPFLSCAVRICGVEFPLGDHLRGGIAGFAARGLLVAGDSIDSSECVPVPAALSGEGHPNLWGRVSFPHALRQALQ